MPDRYVRIECQKICQIECQKICQNICQKICQIECQIECQKICQDRVPEDMPDRMAEDLPDRMPEDMPEDMPDHMPEDMPDRMPNRMSEDMSDRMPEDLPVRKCINIMVGITRSKVIDLFLMRVSTIVVDWPPMLVESPCFLVRATVPLVGKNINAQQDAWKEQRQLLEVRTFGGGTL